MFKYKISRPNTIARGVVFTDYATALFISNSITGYADSYIDLVKYLQDAGEGADADEAPEVTYQYPISNPGEQDGYQLNAKNHLNGLKDDATGTEGIDFTNVYEQPFSKIFVFLKIPVSGLAARKAEGPYICLGRFRAMRPRHGNPRTSIRLQLYEPPREGDASYDRGRLPSAGPTEVDVRVAQEALFLLSGQSAAAATGTADAAAAGGSESDGTDVSG